MKNIYLFSGLGVDKRVFQDMDFSGFHITHIEWILPDNNETIHTYAKRICNQIKTEDPILIGLSFGGMMAIEVAKLIPVEHIILIASVKTRKELPYYFKLAGFFKLHRLFPLRLLRYSNFFIRWLFGVSNPQEGVLLQKILTDTHPKVLKWSIDQVLGWKNQTEFKNLLHIHGSNDHVLPARYLNCDITIKDGGHFMTVSKAAEISQIIRTHLNN